MTSTAPDQLATPRSDHESCGQPQTCAQPQETPMPSSRIHAQTLAELNHCVGTARRNAAFTHLGEIAQPGPWQETCKGRTAMYGCCLDLIQEVLATTEKSPRPQLSAASDASSRVVSDRPLRVKSRQ